MQLSQASANRLGPGRKPFHTLNPPLARLADGRLMSYGTMGGEGQPQTQAAVFSRIATFGVLLAAAAAAWWGQNLNITLLSAIGFGGMSAAFAGPLILGILWNGVTRIGAFAGFITGAAVFISVISGAVITTGGQGPTRGCPR